MTTRREFFKKGILTGAGLTLLNHSFGKETDLDVQSETLNRKPETDFTLPPLPYEYNALEPFIDKQTMEIHHTKHHKTYVDKLNSAMADKKNSGITLEKILKDISEFPDVVRNNAGGHYNHSMFWKLMKPNTGSVLSPSATNELSGKLGNSIKSTFDSFENFKTKFSEAAMKVFGSGWAWLVINKEGKLEVGSTPNQDNPLMNVSGLRGIPILGLDVWEHAYYLKYQNKRTDYIANWWNILNWEEANRRFEEK